MIFTNLLFQLGWNNHFNRLVARFHPNVWHLFDCFRMEEVCMRQKMLKMVMGKNKNTNKKTNDFHKNYESLQSRFDGKTITIDEFFEGLTLLISTKN